jgi:integrase
VLDQARRGTLPGQVQSGVKFADAAAEWLRFIEHDRRRKPSTLEGYRSVVRTHLLPAFGELPLESVTTRLVEQWSERIEGSASKRRLALVLLHGIFRRAMKVWELPSNPVANVEKPPLVRSGDLEVFSPEEVWALVRAAGSEQDAAIFLTAAFTGLRRGEVLALRWRDVDFGGSVIRVRASYSAGVVTAPKSGKVRSVPMAPDVAEALARLSARGHSTGDDDLVFVGDHRSYVDPRALTRRYEMALKRARLRRLRFHDLRHTFGTRMIGKADIRRVQEWMGHSDIQTTMKYLHYAPREEDARLVAEAFRLEHAAADASGGQ